jgi:hypothetical protein
VAVYIVAKFSREVSYVAEIDNQAPMVIPSTPDPIDSVPIVDNNSGDMDGGTF